MSNSFFVSFSVSSKVSCIKNFKRDRVPYKSRQSFREQITDTSVVSNLSSGNLPQYSPKCSEFTILLHTSNAATR
ncbi:unnamed protein product [Acanthoscelides obtectus]|uniref:Uncharacterized protein n=1 Tax=Acanthoscelides obtectus TaxID=200917 RepID=A0A9P0MBP3_ACAOB|nr:unnamed protein product [Acanthoscelides obtectus]CAK1627655.1 hypothetical protein AOBTE_LOCUS4736 [Acanthoscelides obtectus]